MNRRVMHQKSSMKRQYSEKNEPRKHQMNKGFFGAYSVSKNMIIWNHTIETVTWNSNEPPNPIRDAFYEYSISTGNVHRLAKKKVSAVDELHEKKRRAAESIGIHLNGVCSWIRFSLCSFWCCVLSVQVRSMSRGNIVVLSIHIRWFGCLGLVWTYSWYLHFPHRANVCRRYVFISHPSSNYRSCLSLIPLHVMYKPLYTSDCNVVSCMSLYPFP
jgi:hypothetical protein